MKIFHPSRLFLALALVAGSVQASECAPSAKLDTRPQAAIAQFDPGQPFYYNPWADLLRMQALLNGPLLNNPFNATNRLGWPSMFVPMPAVPMPVSTLQSSADGYRLVLPMPGFKAEDIHVHVDGALLSITAKTANTVKTGQQEAQSQSRQSFAETLTLPGPVQASALEQSFKDGVLTVSIPAAAAAKPKASTGSI